MNPLNHKSKLETVASLVPLITGYFIILGSIRLTVYYSFFDLPIFEYLTLSEILMSFFERSLIIGLGILFVYAIVEFFLTKIRMASGFEYQKSFLAGSTRYKLYDFFIKDWFLVLINILFFSSIFLNIFFENRVNGIFVTWLIILNLFNLIVKFIERIIDYKEDVNSTNTSNFNFSHLFYLGNFYLLTTILTSVNEAQALKIFDKGSKTYFTYNDGNIFKPDSSQFVIGKSQGYIFIYHKKEMRSEAIKVADIKTISYFSK